MKKEFEKSKGASDLLAYYVHRPLENKIVLKLVNTKITPNQVTILTNMVAYMVTLSYFFGFLLPDRSIDKWDSIHIRCF